MQVGQNDDADRRGSQGSDPGGSSGTSQPLTGSKLRNKLQGFAKWRIDSSSIEFPDDSPKFRGGFATVSRAILVSASGSKSRADDSADTGGEKKSDGGTLGQKAVAVKKLKMDNGEDKVQVLGLALREAGFLTELSHTNVIKLEGFVEDLSEDKVWLVFPWAANGNLKDFVASANWEIPERIWLIDDVARGVEHLHNQNPPIYHGDLKSANVLVNANCRAVITDFGSARRLTKKDPLVQPEKSRKGPQPVLLLEAELSQTNNTVTLKGNQYTLRWAAPELLMEDEPGLWSDIWALGWIFYEVITNSIPFQNVQKDSAIVIRVIQGNLPSVADHASMVLIRELYSLMITCWIIDPSKRPTAEDCRKSMSRMPMVVPDPQRTNASGSRARPPKLLMKLGDMHRHQNDYINASKFYMEALGICAETADSAGKADALLGLARTHKLQGQWSEAVPFYSEAAQIYTDIGNSQGRAGTLRGLADAHRAQGEYSKAVTFYSEAVQISTNIGDTQGRANALWGLADIHRLQDNYGEAAMFYSEAFQIYTNMGSRQGRADALWGLAMVHRVQEQYSQAVQLLSESLQIRIDIGDRYGAAWALKDLAGIHHDQDQHDSAIRLYEQAAEIFEEIGDTQHTADALNCAAEARRKLEPAEAE